MGQLTRIETIGEVLKELNLFEPELREKELGTWLTFIRHELSGAETDLCSYNDKDAAMHHILAIAALATACLEQYGPGQPRNAFGQVPMAGAHTS